MIIYIVFFIISAFISIFDFTNISSFQKKSIFIFFILAIILFFGGRYNCDNDYKNYISFYDITPALHKMSWNKFVKIYIQYQVEPLFFLFSSLFKAIGVNGQSIIFFYAFCTFSLIAKVIEKTSPFPLSSFFLFSTCYFSLPFMQMRFGLGVACCLYAIYKLENNQKSLYWQWVLIGILFHMTAIIGLVYFILHKINLNTKKTYFLLSICFLFIFFPIREIFTFIIKLMGFYRYLNYLNDESVNLTSCILHIIIFSPLFIFQNKLRTIIPFFDMFLKIAILAIIIMVITTQLPILNRFSILFASSSCISLTFYFFLIKKNILNYTIFYALFIFYAFLRFLPSLNYINSYQFFIPLLII